MVERHQDAGRAEAALQRVMAAERRLQNRQPAGLRRQDQRLGLRRPSFLSEESSFAFGSDLLSTQ